MVSESSIGYELKPSASTMLLAYVDNEELAGKCRRTRPNRLAQEPKHIMYRDYTSSTTMREGRPLRKRSISSPRVQFTPFSPFLKHMSPPLPSFSPSPPGTPSPFRPPSHPSIPVRTVSSPVVRFMLPRNQQPLLPTCSSALSRTIGLLILMLILCLIAWGHPSIVTLMGTASENDAAFSDTSYDALLYDNSEQMIITTGPPAQGPGPLDSQYLPHPFQFPMDPLSAFVSAPPGLSVVLPCPSGNISAYLSKLFYALSTHYTSISLLSTIIVCHRSQSRQILPALEEYPGHDVYLKIPDDGDMDTDHALLHVASQVLSDWVLVLDRNGAANLPIESITLLLQSPSLLSVPFGPQGVVISKTGGTCISPRAGTASRPISVAFLVPPFSARTELLRAAENGMFLNNGLGVWENLGRRISQMSGSSATGGLVVGSQLFTFPWCPDALRYLTHEVSPALPNRKASLGLNSPSALAFYQSLENVRTSGFKTGFFVVLLPAMSDLHRFAGTLCRLSLHGHTLRILLYEEPGSYDLGTFDHTKCHVHYQLLGPSASSNSSSSISDWLHIAGLGDVFLVVSSSPSAMLSIESGISKNFGSHPQATPVVVAIPRTELAYTEWCGTLDIEEWRRWHRPRLDLVVVTNDRPSSLRRLLLSLQTSVFFGDRVNLHINIEQTADPETRGIVHSLNWTNGDVIVRHRVILGGLLPAIVESWYPSSNDSYGLILEDDVEVSPMFYAWTKMALLRYRYGLEVHLSNRLFGISLYQQKNIELRPEGRRPFDPRKLFEEHKLTFPDTPYSSQIPCSWGAVYFPEHWREFHSYLVDRLSERKLTITNAIVPDIRSNRWTKSWKKYFIELVYLRGYVMLYPNYADFISLSTNHLEMGVHVRGDPSTRDFLKKKALFDLPLMPLPQEPTSDDTPSILDLPFGSLPRWNSLPVVDLWGYLSSGEDIVRTGQRRHQHMMTGCPPLNLSASEFDASLLLCTTASSTHPLRQRK